MNPQDRQQAFTLRIIRLGLLLGVLLFIAVSFWLHRSREITGNYAFFVPLVLALCAGAIGAIILLRNLQQRAASLRRQGELAVIGWGIGEAPALAGAVHYFVSAETTWMMVGLAVMLLSFIALPIPDPDAPAP